MIGGLFAVIGVLCATNLWQAHQARKQLTMLLRSWRNDREDEAAARADTDERHAKERGRLIGSLLVREGAPASIAAGGMVASRDRVDEAESGEPTDEHPIRVGEGWELVTS